MSGHPHNRSPLCAENGCPDHGKPAPIWHYLCDWGEGWGGQALLSPPHWWIDADDLGTHYVRCVKHSTGIPKGWEP
jgi:hypothetical protein